MLLSKIYYKIKSLYDQSILWPVKYLVLKGNGVQFDQFPSLNGIPLIKNRGTFKMGEQVKITSRISSNAVGGRERTAIVIAKNASLQLGNGVAISNATIFCMKEVIIEDHVLIGGGAQIYDSDFHSLDFFNRMKSPDPDIRSAAVKIGKGAFIGTSAIILKGVQIGEESIIAAGSVVAKSIPPRQIWGGNPAKFIADLEPSLAQATK